MYVCIIIIIIKCPTKCQTHFQYATSWKRLKILSMSPLSLKIIFLGGGGGELILGGAMSFFNTSSSPPLSTPKLFSTTSNKTKIFVYIQLS